MEILFALRKNPSSTKTSPYERYTEQEPNTIKRKITNKSRFIPEIPEFQLSGNAFESGQDSTIMVRERSRGSKLERAFKKRKGVLLENSNHTITFLPVGRTQKTIIARRDIGQMKEEQPCCSKWLLQSEKSQAEEKTNERKEAENKNMRIENEMPPENEIPEEKELTNQNEAINKEPMKGKNAIEKMRELKKKA